LCASSLRAAREHAGLTLEAAAAGLGRSPHTLRGWESGRYAPTVAMLADLAALYGTTPAAFFSGAAHAAA
jgi:transcriptional regulator with XRE-family HTH domain